MATTALVLSGLVAAASAGLAYSQAQQANRARRRQNEAIQQAVAAERATAQASAAERREKVARQQAQYIGTVRASSAARSASGTSLRLAGYAQGAESVSDINTQLMYDILGITSTGEARKDRNTNNAFASGFQGGLSGFSTGLSIISGVQSIYGSDT